MFGGREKVENVEAAFEDVFRFNARSVSGEMGIAAWLSHGRPQLRQEAVSVRKEF